MSELYCPFIQTWPTGSSWMASGIAADFVAKLSRSTPTTADLVEMMTGPRAGRVTKAEVGPSGLLIEAEVTSAVAALKISERVYHGFGIVATLDTEGNAVIQRVALLDAPDIIGKSAKAPPWSSLWIEERLKKMSLRSSLKKIETRRAASLPEKRIEFGKAADADGRSIDPRTQRAAEVPAIDMLKQFFRANPGGNCQHPFLGSLK
jgi:hypothetical protein